MMKNLLFTLMMLVSSSMLMAQNTYYWTGTDATTTYDATAGWNTAEDGTGTERAAYDVGDILIVKGAGKEVEIIVTANSKELLQLQVLDGAKVTLISTQTSGAAWYFYLKGDAIRKGLLVTNGSILTLGTAQASYSAFNIVLTKGGDINASTLTNISGKTSRLITKVAGGLVFDNGSVCNFASSEGFGQGAQAAPATTGNLNSAIEAVVFKSGTQLYHTGAGIPFAGGTDPNVKFEAGSYYYYQSNSATSGTNLFKNRTFGHLIIDEGASYVSTANNDMFAKVATLEIRQNAVFKFNTAAAGASTGQVDANINLGAGATLDLGMHKLDLGHHSFTANGGSTLGTALPEGFEANIITTGTKSFNGIINFEFTRGSIITPFPAGITQIGGLKINSITVTLDRNITMQGALELNGNNSRLYLDASDGNGGYNSYDVTMSSAAIIATGNNSYIATKGIGKLNVQGLTSSILIPLGTFYPANNYLYTPVTISPANVSNFSVTVFRDITVDARPGGTSFTNTNKLNKVNTTWILERTSGTGSYDVTLGWTNNVAGTDFKNLTNDKIGVSQYDAVNGYSAYTANTAANTTDAGGTVTTTLTNNGGALVVGEGTNTLPVELIAFTAQKQGNSVNLKWSTASENNNSHFIVERSADGVNFTAIGRREGAGNSTTVQNYAFTDNNPVKGDNYYRLVQYDLDNKANLHGVQVVNFSGSTQGLSVQTNQNMQEVTFYVNSVDSGLAQVTVYAIDGKKLAEGKVNINKGNNTCTLNTPSLGKGIHTLVYQLGSESYQVKFAK